ncbi:MAG: hypothetical protein AAGA65_02335 [Actinomycetota bacterium]
MRPGPAGRRRKTVVCVAFGLGMLVGCSADASEVSGGDDDRPQISAERLDPELPSSETTSTDIPDSQPPTTSRLAVDLPEEEPEAAGFIVIEQGSGVVLASGDVVLMAWEMVAFDTGETVESTADFGGPVPIELGSGAVPAALDEAVIGQPVGSQLQVRFPAGMPDLPEYLDAGRAYILAVDLVELFDPDLAAAPTTTAADARPTTTSPPGEVTAFVRPDGPLAVDLPVDAPLPARNSHQVVSVGSGDPVLEGDTVQLDYVKVSWTSGEIVWSTSDQPAGTESIVLGRREVPRILENAIFQQPVGSRVQVVYAPDLPDLPVGFDPEDAYVIAVDIVGRE